MKKWINGRGTNLGLIALGALGICYEMGWTEWMDERMVSSIGIALASWTGVRIRHAYSKGK